MDTTALDWAKAAFTTHGAEYLTYHRYLVGEQPLEFATEKFKSAFGRQFKKFAYNRCAMVVDAHADRLQVSGFGADDESVSQSAQDLWDDNHMDVRQGQVEAEALAMGDSYVIVEVHPVTGEVLYWPQYAANVRVQYSDTMPGQIDQAARRWIDDDKYLRLNLYYPNRIEKYRSMNKVTGNSIADFNIKSLDRFQPEGDLAWPVMLTVNDTVPVFHFANNGRVNAYGQSELRDVIPLQDAINKTVMDMLVAMEFAAFPQRVVLNVDVAEDATVDALQRFQTGIDRILALTGSGDAPASIAEFGAANMTQYLDVAEKFDQFISRVSRVPSRYLTQDGAQTSGESKRMDEGPFVSKIEDIQRARGSVWSDVQRYGLRLQGVESEPGAIRVNWVPAAPLSAEEELNQALMRSSLGFPLEANLRMMGFDPDEIATIIEEKKKEADEAMREFNRGMPAVAGPIDDEDENEAA